MRRQRVGHLPVHSDLLLFLVLLCVVCLRTFSDAATQVNIAVTNNNVNTIINSGDSSGHTLKPGRHVCKRERVIQVPVKHPQTYSRPIYRRLVEPCVGSTSGYCTVVRVVYQTSVRHVVRLETKHQVMYSCCPGWGRTANEETDCLKPTCDAGCQHGGACIAPNKCSCPPQWSGEFCENDVDECAAKTDRCQQFCINQDGAYTCGCHRGFSLQSDGRTCSLCLTCSPEFRQMQSDYKQLNRRVLRAEREKTQIRKTVNKLKRTLRRCTRHKCKRQRTSHWTTPTTAMTTTTQLTTSTAQPITTTTKPTTTMTTTQLTTSTVQPTTTTTKPTTTTTEPTTPTTEPTTPTTEPTTPTTESTTTATTTKMTTTPTTNRPDNIKRTTVPITDKPLKSIEDMMHSLSEQIAILEERLEECTCQGLSRTLY